VTFRKGRHHNGAMNTLLMNMTDAYLLEIATYYASLDLPYARPSAMPTTAQAMARGGRLVKDGNAALPS
jgi:cytochrome c553